MGRRFTPSSSRGQHRALRRNQVNDLVLYGSLTTTEARAKILKTEVERLISRAKKADLATRRRVLAFLPSDRAAKKLFEQIVPQFMERVGGYVRVVKLPPRRGDNAPMARVEFVEEIKERVAEKPEETKVAKRKPRAKKKKDGKKDKSNESKRS